MSLFSPPISSRKVIDMLLGAVVMGTVGVLIGVLMDNQMIVLVTAAGVAMGAVIGMFGGRRFLMRSCSARSSGEDWHGSWRERTRSHWAPAPGPRWEGFSACSLRCSSIYGPSVNERPSPRVPGNKDIWRIKGC